MGGRTKIINKLNKHIVDDMEIKIATENLNI